MRKGPTSLCRGTGTAASALRQPSLKRSLLNKYLPFVPGSLAYNPASRAGRTPGAGRGSRGRRSGPLPAVSTAPSPEGPATALRCRPPGGSRQDGSPKPLPPRHPGALTGRQGQPPSFRFSERHLRGRGRAVPPLPRLHLLRPLLWATAPPPPPQTHSTAQLAHVGQGTALVPPREPWSRASVGPGGTSGLDPRTIFGKKSRGKTPTSLAPHPAWSSPQRLRGVPLVCPGTGGVTPQFWAVSSRSRGADE